MTRGQKVGWFCLVAVISMVGTMVITELKSDKARAVKVSAPAEPRVIKVEEVVGQVVGGPQIVTGHSLIGYVVYIAETKTWGALRAEGCPPQTRDYSRVVMYQRDIKPGGFGSAWYTFIRYEE